MTKADLSFPLNAKVGLGEGSLQRAIYEPIFTSLSGYKVKTLGDIENDVREKGLTLSTLIQPIFLLAGLGHISFVQDEQTIKSSLMTSQALNQDLRMRSRSIYGLNYLGSPLTGGAVSVSKFDQLFLSAFLGGKKDPAQLAAFVWEILSSQGQSLLNSDGTLKTSEQSISDLRERAADFINSQLPVLKALQIA